MRRLSAFLVPGLLASFAWTPAWAQVAASGPTRQVIPAFTRANDSAHDPINHVFLVVSGYGSVQGVFVNETGLPVGAVFPIAANPAFLAKNPRVIYSPNLNGNAGGFMVIWHQNDGPTVAGAATNVVHARPVAYGANPILGADTSVGLSGTAGSWPEIAPAVAYSPATRAFQIVWQTTDPVIQGVRIDLTGQTIGSIFQISNGPGRFPSIAYGERVLSSGVVDDRFAVAYSGWDAQGATTNVRLVSGGSFFSENPTVVERSGGSFITDITYNSQFQSFVLAYTTPDPKTAELSFLGYVVARGVTSTSVGAQDGLGLAYNPVSGTILMVGRDGPDVRGVELDGHGAKMGTEQRITAGGGSNLAFFPRVSSASTAKVWSVTYGQDLASTAEQIVITTATTGGTVVDRDGDGVLDGADSCPETPAATANGCPAPDTDGDGVRDDVDPCPTTYARSANGCPVAAPTSGDFDGTPGAELIFVHKITGQAYAWTMNGASFSMGNFLYNAYDPGWSIVGTSDLTGDGHADLLWQHEQTRASRLFKMTYLSKVGELNDVVSPVWRIEATGDFDHDGQGDLVLHHLQFGYFAILPMKGGVAQNELGYFVTSGDPLSLSTDWRCVGTTDFDGDGQLDMLLQNSTSGEIRIWTLSTGGMRLANTPLATVATSWQVRAVANLAGDPREDLVFQNITTGSLYLWTRSGSGFAPDRYLTPAAVNPDWVLSGPK